MNNNEFYKKYGCYENFRVDKLKHIKELSTYNHNYYIGIQRENTESPDIIYVESDELSDTNEYYHVEGDNKIHIGYSYEGDEYITLQQEELT